MYALIPKYISSMWIQNIREIIADQSHTHVWWVGVILVCALTLAVWYVTVPAVVLWYVYKINTRFTLLQKHVFASVLLLIMGVGSFGYLHHNRAPVLVILAPEFNTTVQQNSAIIVGQVTPVHAKVLINATPVSTDVTGRFVYDASLPDKMNNFSVKAHNGDKIRSTIVIIEREFTKEDLVARRADAAQALLP